MMAETKTGGVNNKHTTTAFYMGGNANRHDKSGTLCTMSYTFISSQRTQNSTCGNKGKELSGAY